MTVVVIDGASSMPWKKVRFDTEGRTVVGWMHGDILRTLR